MISPIAKLFGKQPFHTLQSHMKKVSSCIKKLMEIFENLTNLSPENLKKMVKDLSKLEYEADLVKNDISSRLDKSLFLPIDRGELLEILSEQDDIADKAEDIGHLLVLCPVDELGKDLCGNLKDLFEKNIMGFWDVRNIIKELHELLEYSFGGAEAERIREIIESTCRKEYESDKMKHRLMEEFFKIAKGVSTPVLYIYMRLIEEINQISHISEKLANRIRRILALK